MPQELLLIDLREEEEHRSMNPGSMTQLPLRARAAERTRGEPDEVGGASDKGFMSIVKGGGPCLISAGGQSATQKTNYYLPKQVDQTPAAHLPQWRPQQQPPQLTAQT